MLDFARAGYAVAPDLTLRLGSRGDCVLYLKSYLRESGLDYGYLNDASTFNNLFDAATANAIKSYQKNHGLTVDGIVGPKTWASIDDGLYNMLNPQEQPYCFQSAPPPAGGGGGTPPPSNGSGGGLNIGLGPTLTIPLDKALLWGGGILAVSAAFAWLMTSISSAAAEKAVQNARSRK
jgi:peptidoglycan hydrolase-like protein with peptidoglycan-binding domain